jgi:hypothetical protein
MLSVFHSPVSSTCKSNKHMPHTIRSSRKKSKARDCTPSSPGHCSVTLSFSLKSPIVRNLASELFSQAPLSTEDVITDENFLLADMILSDSEVPNSCQLLKYFFKKFNERDDAILNCLGADCIIEILGQPVEEYTKTINTLASSITTLDADFSTSVYEESGSIITVPGKYSTPNGSGSFVASGKVKDNHIIHIKLLFS